VSKKRLSSFPSVENTHFRVPASCQYLLAIHVLDFSVKMKKSLGDKRNKISSEQIETITKLYTTFEDNEYVKIFDNSFFGYRKITVERPLRLNFQVSSERIRKLKEQKAFQNLAKSKKKGMQR
jgi:type I restriction enzyme M protein